MTGAATVDLSIEAAMELWDHLGRYLEARAGFLEAASQSADGD